MTMCYSFSLENLKKKKIRLTILCVMCYLFKKKSDQIIFAIVNKWITDTFSVLYNRL